MDYPWSKKNLVNDWEDIIVYWAKRDVSDQVLVHSKNNWGCCSGDSGVTPGKICNFYLHLNLESVSST